MANLLWHSKSKPRILNEIPFKTEEEFEKIVFDSKKILSDIFLLKRQIRGGGKPGIPDIIGVDADGNVCIIEMKNVVVDENIISQLVKYAIWAKNYPDSIKALWLENENKPDDIEIDWSNIQVRLIVIAPSVLQSAINSAQEIVSNVEFIEINRWVFKNDHFFLIKKLEKELKQTKVKNAHGLPVYDEKYYKSQRNHESVKYFIKYSKEVNRLIKHNKWDLEMKFNKYYCGFNQGFFRAFGVKWLGTKSIGFFVMISEQEAKKLKVPYSKYLTNWKQALYIIEPGKTKVSDYAKVFKFAYEKLKGK